MSFYANYPEAYFSKDVDQGCSRYPLLEIKLSVRANTLPSAPRLMRYSIRFSYETDTIVDL